MTIRSDDTAHCRRPGIDPESFFPTSGTNKSRIKKAQGICRGCPFMAPCLDYALHHAVEGIWGGTTPDERRDLRKTRGIKAEPLSFGTGHTTSTTVKRMAGRGTPVATIAAHLQLTQEAVYRILRLADVQIPEARSRRGIAPRSTCPGCGKSMLRSSLGRHQRDVCSARGRVAS